MTTPDHTPANKLIGQMFNPGVVGFYAKHPILRVNIELPQGAPADKKVRSVCIGENDTVIDIAESGSIIDIAACLGREFAIDRKYLMDRYEFRVAYEERFKAVEAWNDLQRRECQDTCEFVAENVIYSVVTRPAHRVAKPNEPTEEYGPIFECYAQKANDPDPDSNLLDEDAFTNMFDAMVWVRLRLEKALIAALMPEVKL